MRLLAVPERKRPHWVGAALATAALLWLQAPPVPAADGTTSAETVALASLPYQVVERFRASEFNAGYAIGYRAVNPFYLAGDFDGDGQMDYALRLVSKSNRAKEADAIFFAKGAPRLLSKDIKEEYPGPAWYVVARNDKSSLGETKPKGDAIMMVRPESSSALVFWNGKSFELAWMGD